MKTSTDVRVMVDFRCPKCNSILTGTHEVKHMMLSKVSKTCTCRRCKKSCKLAKPFNDGLGLEVYYR